jgi:hypothetical protein
VTLRDDDLVVQTRRNTMGSAAARRSVLVPLRFADIPAPALAPPDTEPIRRALQAEARRRKARAGRILSLVGSGAAAPGVPATHGAMTVHSRAAGEPPHRGDRERRIDTPTSP